VAENQTLADLLRQKAQSVIDFPTNVARNLSDPQAFLKSFGYTPSQQLSGFSAGYAGVPEKPPSDIGVLDPRNIEYNKGYGSGEDAALATMVAAPFAPLAKPIAKAAGRQAWNATENMMINQGLMPSIVPRNESLANALRNTKTAEFDPRYDTRKLEQERLKNLITHTEQLNLNPIPSVSLADFEGRPFITSMADRTAAGADLLGVNGVMYKRPVPLYGGQDYMFNNPNQVWASAQSAVTPIIQNAKILKEATGQNPIYIPWRMAPTGGDFAHMTGESMIAHAEAAMGKSDKTALNNSIKELLPSWKGVDSPQNISQYRSAPKKVRDAIMQVMDRDFRDLGGLNYGEARIAVSDPRQLNAMEGGIQNVGEIFADKPMIMHSGHPSYPRGVAGQGLGRLEENRNIFELLPNVAKERGIVNPTNPSANDLRALQMKPYAGILTPKLLKDLGY
jgi:hypothetical protein